MVTDAALLTARSEGARAEAPWSFRHLVEAMAAPEDPSTFVAKWLASWEKTATDASEGSLPLGVRVDVRNELACPWLRATPANGCNATCSICTSETYDLAKAPFKLLAIVNRLDLAETMTGCQPGASEGRFVFVAMRDGAPQSLNVIFEYGVDGTKAGDPNAWHALGSLQGQPYGVALEALTRSFTDRTPDKPSMLKQLRTSENLGAFRGTSFELRQFALRGGWLTPTALTNTARDAVNGTSALSEHVMRYTSQIFEGDNAITPTQRTAVSTMPRADFKWTDATNGDNPVIDLFGLSTCNGCHAGHRGDTTILPFAHVGVDSAGRTILSRFVDDPQNPEGDELAFRGRSLARRMEGQCGSPEATYGGRRGGKGGGGAIPKRDLSVGRTH